MAEQATARPGSVDAGGRDRLWSWWLVLGVVVFVGLLTLGFLSTLLLARAWRSGRGFVCAYGRRSSPVIPAGLRAPHNRVSDAVGIRSRDPAVGDGLPGPEGRWAALCGWWDDVAVRSSAVARGLGVPVARFERCALVWSGMVAAG